MFLVSTATQVNSKYYFARVRSKHVDLEFWMARTGLYIVLQAEKTPQ